MEAPGDGEHLAAQQACEHGTRQVGLQPSALHAARRLFGPDWADLVGCSHSRPVLGLRMFGCQSHWPFDWTRIEDSQNPHWAAAWAAGMAGSPDKQRSVGSAWDNPRLREAVPRLAGSREGGRHPERQTGRQLRRGVPDQSPQPATSSRRIGQCPIPCATVTHPPGCGAQGPSSKSLWLLWHDPHRPTELGFPSRHAPKLDPVLITRRGVVTPWTKRGQSLGGGVDRTC